ncbi:hypothetical protein CBM2589_A90997 [Cupriavidus taiwanensis]|uniref:Uncharacterized protein n=1 Tax=Cupriavidus taiwanensis TaxID=164546 RepID=A0A975XH06_9BURK|nr:hypothetical protein CBM2589_A90997 [Cupriavidus taiwanensis]
MSPWWRAGRRRRRIAIKKKPPVQGPMACEVRVERGVQRAVSLTPLAYGFHNANAVIARRQRSANPRREAVPSGSKRLSFASCRAPARPWLLARPLRGQPKASFAIQ